MPISLDRAQRERGSEGIQRLAPQNRRRISRDRTLGSLSELNEWQRIIGDELERLQSASAAARSQAERPCRGMEGEGFPVA